MVFLPHTNTVILLDPYCGTITEPGLPVLLNRPTHRLQMTLECSPLKTAPYVCYRSMTIIRRTVQSVIYSAQARLALCNVTAVAAVCA